MKVNQLKINSLVDVQLWLDQTWMLENTFYILVCEVYKQTSKEQLNVTLGIISFPFFNHTFIQVFVEVAFFFFFLLRSFEDGMQNT